jgi:hypothetical protein
MKPIFTKPRTPAFSSRASNTSGAAYRYEPLSVAVVLLELVPATQHQPDLFSTDHHWRQKLSPLIDRINDRCGRGAIGFGVFQPEVRALRGHAAFHHVPQLWEF